MHFRIYPALSAFWNPDKTLTQKCSHCWLLSHIRVHWKCIFAHFWLLLSKKHHLKCIFMNLFPHNLSAVQHAGLAGMTSYLNTGYSNVLFTSVRLYINHVPSLSERSMSYVLPGGRESLLWQEARLKINTLRTLCFRYSFFRSPSTAAKAIALLIWDTSDGRRRILRQYYVAVWDATNKRLQLPQIKSPWEEGTQWFYSVMITRSMSTYSLGLKLVSLRAGDYHHQEQKVPKTSSFL